MKNKFLWVGILVLVFGMTVIGCTSTSPVIFSDNSTKEYSILGEVTYTAKSGGRQGLIDFLAEARKKYPDTDYIVDVMVDSKVTSFIIFTSHSYVYRGTAIKYKK